jgi:hypothetical protein
MKKILYKNKLVGIFLRTIKKGSLPITDGKEPLQMVTLKHLRGKYLLAHTHKPTPRYTKSMQECLIVKKGKIRIDLYGPDKKMFKKISMREGDSFLLMNGGYGIHFLEDAELLELKNGPFIEDKILL